MDKPYVASLGSQSANEIERLCRRFEIAVANFGQSCIAMKANEKAFQAWFATSVIQEFGMSRVYREIHLAKKELFALSQDIEMARKLSVGNELFPDVSISWLPDIDARHSNTRHHSVRNAGDFLLKFAIITELKVTGSGRISTRIDEIGTDILKLAVFSSAHAAHKRNTPGHNDSTTLRTYMVIMDNFSGSDGKFKSSYTSAKLQGLFDRLSAKWPDDTDKPTILVISSTGTHAKMSVYRGFEPDEPFMA